MEFRSVATVALILGLVAASGCSGLSGGGEAAEVRDRTTAAMQDVSSYNFSMQMDVEAGQGQSLGMSMNGTIDVADRAMYATMTVRGVELTQYVVDGTIYTSALGQWQRQELREGLWNQQNQLAQQRQILQNADVSVVGPTTVDGEAVVELSFEPDPADVEDVVRQNQRQAAASGMSIDDVSYTVFVRQDDSLPKRIVADMAMSSQGQQVDATMTMTFSDYGLDPTIEVPEEALDAPMATAA